MIGHSRAQSAVASRCAENHRYRVFVLRSGCISAPRRSSQTPASQPPADHASAYYDFAMAHLYAELAGAYGNRGEYVNKAIDFYRQAIKADPSASYIAEELTEFYVQTGPAGESACRRRTTC